MANKSNHPSTTNMYPYPENLLRDIQECSGQEPLSSYPDLVKENLAQILENLSSDQLKILQLRYKDGKAFSELGDLYGVTKQAIHSKVSRIIKNLARPKCYEEIFHIPKTPDETHTIEDLELSNHAYYALLRNNIDTLDKLKDIGPEGIAKLRSVGTTTLNEILEKGGFLWE